MDLSLPLLLLLIGVIAAGGIAVGVLAARRPIDAVPATPPPPVVIPDALADLALKVAKEKELSSLLHTAAEWLHQEYKIPLVVVYAYDPATNELISPVVVTSKHNIPELRKHIRLGVSIFGEVAQNRMSRFVPQIAREPRFGPTASDMQSAYAIPLMQASTLLGVLCLQSDKPAAWEDAECWAFDRIAELISGLASAVVRLGYSQQAIQRFDRFQLVAQRLAERLDSQQLFQEIVEASRDMLDTQMSILLNINLENGELQPIAWSGISTEAAALMRSRYKEDLKGLVAWARQPARTPDLRTDQRTASASKSVVVGMLSELAVPVMFFDKLYGVLAVQTNLHRHFTDEETSLLASLAAHAGIALRNAQLYESSQETNVQLEKTVADLIVSRQQAENARLSAVEANRLKTEFVNNMNHELRTPLNAVINFTRIVMDGHAGPVVPQQVEYLGFVHDSGQHLLGLINDILDLAKIEAGKMELRREPTDLEPIIRGVMSTAIGLTREKGLHLRHEIAPDLPRINIDSTRIRQVLLNLVSNAAKFTTEGEIIVRVEQRDRQVIVSVQDTGIGIAAEDIPKVFQEFRQIDGSLQRVETGTGLGMPISQRFVQLHGGEMSVESQIGKGTTVFFSLPLEEPVLEP